MRQVLAGACGESSSVGRVTRPTGAVALCVVAFALLAACGSKVAGTPAAYTPPVVSGALGSKPSIAAPTGSPPTSLVIRDVVVGTGTVAQAGSNLSVQYVGVNYADGKQFDASWDRHQPFPFQLGQGMVIAGWDQGLLGMRVGGRRELVIPPALGYGSGGAGGGAIPPNATLVFVVDLLSVS